VVDDDDLAAAILVRMGVLFRRTAVSRPSRMAEAVNAVERFGFNRRFEISQLARAAPALDAAVAHHGDAGRVVTAVFETAQPIEQDGHHLLVSDVADDSAHWVILLVRRCVGAWVREFVGTAYAPTHLRPYEPLRLRFSFQPSIFRCL